jgi:hypothetical protein
MGEQWQLATLGRMYKESNTFRCDGKIVTIYTKLNRVAAKALKQGRVAVMIM